MGDGMIWTQAIQDKIDEWAFNGVKVDEIASRLYDEFGVNVSSRSVRRFKNKHLPDKADRQPAVKDAIRGTEIVINKDGSQTSSTTIQMTQEQAKDPDYVLRAHGFDSDKWEILSVKNNFWQQNSQENGLIDLYQSKISVRPIKNIVSIQDVVQSFNQEIKSVNIHNVKSGKNNIVISLFDMHFGITRLENLESHLHQIANILKKGYKRVEIIIGGDVLHSDFVTKTQTASNTQLDHVETIRALNEAESFFSTLIGMALELSETVEVKAVSGNHDADSQFYFVWGLSKKFPQVAFDNQLNGTRLAFQFGNIGIMVAHGNLALKRLPMLFANEFSDIWSSSKYRMVASGHFHTEKLSDVDGVVMHQFGTVKPNDPYEHANGYTVGRKHLQLLEFNDERLLATYEVE